MKSTRSIWLGALVAFLCYVACNLKRIKAIVKASGLIAIGVLVFVMLSWAAYGFEGVVYNAASRLNPDKALAFAESDFEFKQRNIVVESDSTRAERLDALLEEISQNRLWGSGLGSRVTVNGEKVITEYTYLEMLRKMGVLGAAVFLFYCYTQSQKRFSYKKAKLFVTKP